VISDLKKKGKKIMWIRKQPQQALIIILLLLFLFGCSPVATDLAGTEWELVSLNGKDIIEGTDITLIFAEEYLGGEMGCNGYGGSPDGGKYRATGGGTFTLDLPLAVTLQLCTEPEGIMDQEAAYIVALRNAAKFRLADNRLEIDNGAGETILIFQVK
jgi:heat shock protein HslJ